MRLSRFVLTLSFLVLLVTGGWAQSRVSLVVIASEGPAQVILSGRLVGVANPRLTTQVAPGNYELLVRKPGLPEFRQRITVGSGGLTVNATLGGAAIQPAPQPIQPAPQPIQPAPQPIQPAPQAITTPASRAATGRYEAEDYIQVSGGPRAEGISAPENGTSLAFIVNGSFAYYGSFNFSSGSQYFRARVSSDTSGGTISIRSGNPNGSELGRLTVQGTSGWHKYATVETTLSAANGQHNLYLVFNGPSGYLFNINWFEFGQSSAVAMAAPQQAPTAVPAASVPVKSAMVSVAAGRTAQNNGNISLGYKLEVGSHEVTNAEFLAFLNDPRSWVKADGTLDSYTLIDINQKEAQIKHNGSAFYLVQGMDVRGAPIDLSSYPVVFVTWYGAAAYCNWLSRQAGLNQAYDKPFSSSFNDFFHAENAGSIEGYRLPLGQEWLYAARGGASGQATTYPGSNNALDTGWFNENTRNAAGASRLVNPSPSANIWDGTMPVGQKIPNELGLFDMAGNVQEWTHERSLRGASFVYNQASVNLDMHSSAHPGNVNNHTGFRVVRTAVGTSRIGASPATQPARPAAPTSPGVSPATPATPASPATQGGTAFFDMPEKGDVYLGKYLYGFYANKSSGSNTTVELKADGTYVVTPGEDKPFTIQSLTGTWIATGNGINIFGTDLARRDSMEYSHNIVGEGSLYLVKVIEWDVTGEWVDAKGNPKYRFKPDGFYESYSYEQWMKEGRWGLVGRSITQMSESSPGSGKYRNTYAILTITAPGVAGNYRLVK